MEVRREPLHCTLMSVRLGWLTDLHLNFVRTSVRRELYGRLRSEELDAVLVGGDTGEAESVLPLLSELAEEARVPVYFVLGNHDFYRGSIAEVREKVLRETAGSKWLHWLPASGVVQMTAQTALIGHDGWADGRCGDFFGSRVDLNDYILIRELRLGQRELFAKLNELGDEAAAFLEQRAMEAAAEYRTTLVLTHAPPFREACWHEGAISDNEWLPHFVCQSAGERLAKVMQGLPERRMLVLCGHTHSPGFLQVLENLEVYTGGSRYGEPVLQRVLEVA